MLRTRLVTRALGLTRSFASAADAPSDAPAPKKLTISRVQTDANPPQFSAGNHPPSAFVPPEIRDATATVATPSSTGPRISHTATGAAAGGPRISRENTDPGAPGAAPRGLRFSRENTDSGAPGAAPREIGRAHV